jgi:two-component sensor histidine kinase
MTAADLLIRKLLRQQKSIAAFGTFAFRQSNLLTILNEAAQVCAEGLGTDFSKVCQYRDDKDDLIVVATYGWNEGVIGYIVAPPDSHTPQGRAFTTRLPVICNVLSNESAFVLPPYYTEYGIISTIAVVINGSDKPFGILEIASDILQDFDQHDIDFLTGFANILGEAVATSKRVEILDATVARMSLLMSQKEVLAQELQHRVRNNLQLVYGMLSKQVDDTHNEADRRGLKAITRRVFTLAQVYNQLLGSEMTRLVNFGAYLEILCGNLAEVQAPADGSIVLRCHSEPVMLDLDVVTALGIVAAELVTNSFEHAFPGGQGVITVALSQIGDNGTATMSVHDDGKGFTPVAGSKRHGVGLVRRLSEQVGGITNVEAVDGTLWTIVFPTEQEGSLRKNIVFDEGA